MSHGCLPLQQHVLRQADSPQARHVSTFDVLASHCLSCHPWLLQVQLQHNKRKSAAIKDLLSTAGTGEPSSGAGAGKHDNGSPAGKHRSPGNPSQVLQGLLDELLATDDEDEGQRSAGAAGRNVFADDSTLFSESVQ
jgi:hypothetical protein